MNFVKELLIDIYNQRKLDNHEFIYKEEILKYKNSHLNHFFGKYKIWKDVPKNPSSTWTNSLSKNIKNNIIFGLKSGVVFYEKGVVFLTKNTKYSKHVFSPYSHINLFHFLKITNKNLTINSKCKKLDSYPAQYYMVEKNIPLSSFDHNFLSSWLELLKERFKIEKERKLKSEQLRNKQRKEYLEKRKIEFQKKKNSVLTRFDKDNNGILDIIEDKDIFDKILKENQSIIIKKEKEFQQKYTHQFVKVGNYINTKTENLRLLFNCINKIQNSKDLETYVSILEKDIYSYNLLLFNSLNLVTTLVNDDRITFYKLYEKFDKINIYNSNYENQLLNKLTSLNNNISELNSNINTLMIEINDMGDRIIDSIDNLSYVTKETNTILDNQLKKLNSSIHTNNLLSVINLYQNSRIHKNIISLKK